VNNLPNVVTWKRNGLDLNPQPFELKSYLELIIIIIIIIFWFPVLNSRGMKKLRYAIQKSTKIKLEWTLLLLLLHGKSLELEQPQYFVDGRGTLQAKKGR